MPETNQPAGQSAPSSNANAESEHDGRSQEQPRMASAAEDARQTSTTSESTRKVRKSSSSEVRR